MTETNQNSSKKLSPKEMGCLTIIVVFGLLAIIGSFIGDGKSSSSSAPVSTYPKECKASCGYSITSSTYDVDGYHMACKAGKNGESMMDKLK